jgi:hypothetical protein
MVNFKEFKQMMKAGAFAADSLSWCMVSAFLIYG